MADERLPDSPVADLGTIAEAEAMLLAPPAPLPARLVPSAPAEVPRANGSLLEIPRQPGSDAPPRPSSASVEAAALRTWLKEALQQERDSLGRDLHMRHAGMIVEASARHAGMIVELERRLRTLAPDGEERAPLVVSDSPRGGNASGWTAWTENGSIPMIAQQVAQPEKDEKRVTTLAIQEVDLPGAAPSTLRFAGDGGPNTPGSVSWMNPSGDESDAVNCAIRTSEAAGNHKTKKNWSQRQSMNTTASASSTSPNSTRVSFRKMERATKLFRTSQIDGEGGGLLLTIVTSPHFEAVSAVIILINAVFAAAQVQYQGLEIGHQIGYRWYDRTADEAWPGASLTFKVVDYMCGFAFTIEILLKAVALRFNFFKDNWNSLDLIVTVCWYVELMGKSSVTIDPTLLRVGRLARLFRLLKLAKKIQGFDSLYLMTTAVQGSVSALGWSCCLLTLLQVIIAFAVNMVLQVAYFGNDRYPEEDRREVFEHWGSFFRSMLTTFEMTLADWPPPCRLLTENVSEWFMLFFIVHKLTIGFAVIGVINGVFIQETFKVAENDDLLMIRQREQMVKTHARKMRRLFEAADSTGDGSLDLEEFKSTMEEPDVQTWMASMDLDVQNATVVFQLVDADGDGKLTAEELVAGVSRLMGAARNLDLMVLMQEQKEIMNGLEEIRTGFGISRSKTSRRTHASINLAQTRLEGLGSRRYLH